MPFLHRVNLETQAAEGCLTLKQQFLHVFKFSGPNVTWPNFLLRNCSLEEQTKWWTGFNHLKGTFTLCSIGFGWRGSVLHRGCARIGRSVTRVFVEVGGFEGPYQQFRCLNLNTLARVNRWLCCLRFFQNAYAAERTILYLMQYSMRNFWF